MEKIFYLIYQTFMKSQAVLCVNLQVNQGVTYCRHRQLIFWIHQI
jgi:hypothetical protein